MTPRSHPVFDRSRKGSRRKFREFLRERGILVRRAPPELLPAAPTDAQPPPASGAAAEPSPAGGKGRHFFMRLLLEFRYLVLQMAILSIVLVGMEGLARWMPKVMIDHVFPMESMDWFRIALLGLIGLTVGSLGFGTLQQLVGHRLSGNLTTHLKRRLMRKLLQLPLPRLQEMKVGGLISRLQGDTAQTAHLMNEGVLTPLRASLQLIVSIGSFFLVSARVALMAIACLGLMSLVALFFIHVMRPIRRMLREEEAILSGHAAETFSGLQVVRSYHKERSESRAYAGAVDLLWRKTFHANALSIGAHQVMSLAHGLLSIVFWGYGGSLVMKGDLMPGELVLFISFTDWFFHPIMMLMGSINNLQNSLACAERVYEVIDMPLPALDRPGGPAAPREWEDITFENVTFRYPETAADARPALSGLNLTLRRGQVTALVGVSGAGKTTVTNLAIRFYEPTEGRILVGNRPLTDFDAAGWRAGCGLVLQDVFLFDGTVRENIAYGRLDAAMETIEHAARAANAHDFILALPKGYDTVVGERGAKLSGGQRQRLALARALITDPALLILDEATSALDSESEALIQEALRKLFRDRTTLVIAHRLSTILDADQIVVLEEGRMLESGTHEELLARGGRYHGLWTRQMDRAKHAALTWSDD